MIYLGTDHAGFKLKEEIKKFLNENNIPYEDMGNVKFEPKDDYPKFAKKVADKVAKNPSRHRGILLCGGGNGICIAANKIKNIRAALCFTEYDAKMARTDDNANILCLAGRVTPPGQAKKVVKTFLQTKFSNLQRHRRRIKQINKLEKK